jgi:hypothetical protein
MPAIGEAESSELTRLLGQWREAAGLDAGEERQFALLLQRCLASRKTEKPDEQV